MVRKMLNLLHKHIGRNPRFDREGHWADIWDIAQTLGRHWADIGKKTLGSHQADIGQILGRQCSPPYIF